MKKKFALEQKPMLDAIEQILYKYRPLSTKNKGETFKEIAMKTKTIEYKSLVSMFLQDLLEEEDQELISDIKYFLENKDTLNTVTNYRGYQYEFMLMHLGAILYHHDMISRLEPVCNSGYFSKLKDDVKDELINYLPEIKRVYNKHEKIVADMLESVT